MTELRRGFKNGDSSVSYSVPGDIVVNGNVLTLPLLDADSNPELRSVRKVDIEKFLSDDVFKAGVKLIRTDGGSPVVGGQKVHSTDVLNPVLD